MHRPPTKSITHFAILSLAAYAFWGCQKEFSIEDASIFTKVPETREEKVNIQGIVLDDAGKPLAGADVRAGYQTLRTDRYGIFRFERVPINANGGLVTVQKEGYFMGSRSMLYEKETTNFMRIRLVKKKLAGTIDAAKGGKLAVGEASIDFPANAFTIKGSTAAYTRAVKVYAAFLPGNNVQILDEMPGNLYGIRSDSSFAGLETLGMMRVEIEGEAGEPVTLQTGKEATLDIPALSNAPSTVPIWHFDDRSGFWRQEGMAVKAGARLVAKVKHFSSWNWDLPYRVIKMKATFVTIDGKPLQNARLILKRTNVTDNTKLCVQAITDSSGTIQGPLPANEVVTLSLLGACGEVLFTKSIGPVNTDTDFGSYQVPSSQVRWVEVAGRLIDCNNQPVKRGYFSLLVQDRAYRSAIDSLGRFSLRFPDCNNATTADATGYDANSNREGDVTRINLTSANASTGDIRICVAVVAQNYFIEYSINGPLFKIMTPKDSINAQYRSAQGQGSPSQFFVSGYSLNNQTISLISFLIATDGTVGLKTLLTFSANGLRNANTNGAKVDITKWDVLGNVEGNMIATLLDDSTSRNVPVTLNFRVKRF